jgi:3-hydroxyisobutyrate dehydrogenase-like beta-hydroxyacid dehydrogenase
MSFSRICLIGFGEVGQTLAEDLLKAGVKNLTAYDLLFRKADSAPSVAAERIGVKACANANKAALNAELILCAVTAASDLDAARSMAGAIATGAFYVDMNSASPGVKQKAAQIVDAAGGRYVEAAVMTPIGPKRIASPTLLGGPHAAAYMPRAKALGFNVSVASDEIGRASATKMCRSVIIKGMEALLTESMISARYYGVEKEVLASLSDMLPVPDWPKLARYMISRGLEHGVRRAEEMREVAKTVQEAGLDPLMSAACAERQDWSALHKGALSEAELGAMLDHLLRDIGETPPPLAGEGQGRGRRDARR